MEVNEEEACWVRKIFEQYLKGHSVQEIQQELIKNRIRTPSAVKLGGQDYHWSISTIKKILSNEVYMGAVVQGKSRRKSFKEKKIVACPRNSWIIVEGMHVPIIEKEQFEMVRELRRQRMKKHR